jgi:hypothetical protein
MERTLTVRDVALKLGQVWRECDPRETRFVRILNLKPGRRGVLICTMVMTGDGSVESPHAWVPASRSHARWADHERFNGKRGGYELYEDVP